MFEQFHPKENSPVRENEEQVKEKKIIRYCVESLCPVNNEEWDQLRRVKGLGGDMGNNF